MLRMRRPVSPSTALWTVLFAVVGLGPGMAILPGAATWRNFACGAFVLFLGFSVWGMLFGAGLPLARRAVARSVGRGSSMAARGGFALAAVGALVLAPALMTAPRHWTASKWFDDTMAFSNVHRFLDSGCDPDALFFRSFLRPTFVGFMMPVATLDPRFQITMTRSPSDNFRREWHIYHEDDSAPYGRRPVTAYAAGSQLVRALLCLVPALMFGIAVALGCGRWLALLPGPLVLYWHLRGIEELVTQSFNLFVVVLMFCMGVTAGLGRWGRGWRGAMSGAGFGSGILLIHSMAVAVLPMLAWPWWVAHGRGRRLVRCMGHVWTPVMMVATVAAWYEGFLGGFFYEQLVFLVEQEETQRLMGYPPNTWGEIWWRLSHLLGWICWPIVVLMLLSLAGLRRRWRVVPVLWGWLLLGVAAIASQDYIFFRFYLYILPPLAMLAAFGAAELPRTRRLWSATKSRRLPLPGPILR